MAIIIQIQNISTVMTDAQVQTVLDAVTHQVAEDAAPYWGNQQVAFTIVAKVCAMNPKIFQFVIADTSDQTGAAGYHETTAAGEAIGYAFAKTTLDAGMHPSVTISHEILEIVGDPLIDQSNQWSDLPTALFLGQELCDPVEDDSLGYEKNGVLVSDFVTPAYFVPNSTGPWDFKAHLKAPNTLAPGGYQLNWDPTHGWQQVLAKTANGQLGKRALMLSPFSRRARRMTGRSK